MLLDQVAAGTATVTITARDTEGQAIRQTTVVTVKPEPHGLPEERAALEVFYESTDGPGWTRSTNWKTAAALGQWHGVTTDVEGRVIWLDLQGNSLSGAIPRVGQPDPPQLSGAERQRTERNDSPRVGQPGPPRRYVHPSQSADRGAAGVADEFAAASRLLVPGQCRVVRADDKRVPGLDERDQEPPAVVLSLLPWSENLGTHVQPEFPDGGVGTVGQSFDLDPDNYSPVGLTFANGKFYVVNRSFEKKVYAYLARDSAIPLPTLIWTRTVLARPASCTPTASSTWLIGSTRRFTHTSSPWQNVRFRSWCR